MIDGDTSWARPLKSINGEDDVFTIANGGGRKLGIWANIVVTIHKMDVNNVSQWKHPIKGLVEGT